ncbi:hypothetical protein BLNAU_14824 [Blattamonas nauphoetae]|uniref:Uncharacterized protein n=1 Tax=Blattamonas nauphoetae TaxID=2049346 RepID=A0ABQ9XFQ5_9EUKA|nr:hypothetical protein BLNAU_14824 [Blattamonas nauphoetae]
MIPSDVKAEQTHHQFARDLVSQFTSAFETVPPQVSFALDAIQRHQCPETLQSFYSSFIAALEAKLRKKALSHIEINGLVKGNSDDRMCLNQILAEVVNIKQQEEDRPEHEENTTLNADQQDSTQNITSTSSNSQRHVVIPPLKLNLDDSDYHPTDIHQKDNFIALSDQKPLHDKFEEDCDVRLSLSSEDAVKDPIQGSKVTENSPPLSDLGPASHLPSKVMMFEQSNSDRPHHDTRHTKLRHSVAEAPSQIIRKHQTSYNPQRSSFGGKSNLAKGTAPSIVSSDGWTISTVPSGYNTFPFAVADGGMHNEQFGSTFSSSSKLHRTTTEQMIRLNAVNEERRRMTELMKKEMLLLSKLRRKVKGQVEDKLDQDSFVSLLDELEGMIEQQILFEENLGQSTDENEILRLSKQESRGEVTDAGGSEKENDGNRPEQKVGHKPNNMNPRRTEPVTRSDNRHDEDEVVIEDGDEEGADEHEEIVKTEDPTLNEPTNQTESPKPLSDRVHLEAKKEQPLKQPQQQHAQNDTNSTSKDKHNRQEKAREHPKEHGTRNRRRSPAPLVSQAEEVHDPIPISTSSRSRQESFSLPLNHSLPDQTTPSASHIQGRWPDGEIGIIVVIVLVLLTTRHTHHIHHAIHTDTHIIHIHLAGHTPNDTPQNHRLQKG